MTAAPKPKTGPGMVSGFGQYHTNEADPSDPGKKLTPYVAITWEQIQARVDKPQAVPKPQAQWVIPSTLQSRSKVKQMAEGRYPALWADFDLDPKPINEVADMLDFMVLGYDINREQYSSRSATVAKPKSRALVPLVQPLSAEDWYICQRVFNDLLRTAGLTPDSVTEKCSQFCYLPNRGELYETLSKRDGVPFDPLKEWAPRIKAKREEMAAEAEAERLLKERQAEARKRREAMRQQSGTRGMELIEAFNQAYTPEDFLIEAGYEQRGDTFRHPGSQSGSFSASIKEGADGVLRVHSLSSTDPLYTGGGGGGAHDAFSTFTVLNNGGNVHDATVAAGTQWLKIGDESWNKVQQREFMQGKSSATEGFDDVSGEEEIDPDTGEIKKKIHPLAKFLKCGTEPMTPDWVIPGLIAEGIVTISGAAGVGKTTVLLPLAMTAAGLHEWCYELAPEPDRWRHVIYIVEDIAQANRILAGMLSAQDQGLNKDTVGERFHLVEAMRMDAAEAVKVGKLYRERYSRIVDGVEIKPLVVIDTRSATLAVDNENDNAEAGRVVGALKQRFEGLPTWMIGHLAKGIVNRNSVAELSSRGAGAIEADANQNMYIVKEGDAVDSPRYLVLGKTRFEANWPELAIQSYTAPAMGVDRWGKKSPIVLRWAIASPGLRTRTQAKAAAQEAARAEADAELREEILGAVATAWADKQPLNKGAVRDVVKRANKTVVSTVDGLLASGHLYQVEIPEKDRLVRTRGAFLVQLNDEEREEFIRSGTVPAAKLVVPPSWGKPAKSGVLADAPDLATVGGEK
jgi:hypothetical protein